MVLVGLKPEKVMYFFEEISKMPRGSKNTKGISDYCVNFAKERGLFYIQDGLNNVIIKKNATIGREEDAGIIIQGHLDMVTEKKEESNHDFSKDGLSLYVDGDFIKAEGTTLGADNGIAIAYALAILDSVDISHPFLEVILTVDEEIGMDGAKFINLDNLKGKYLLNLDNEEEGVLIAGCAGGARVKVGFQINKVIKKGKAIEFKISGLKGGHSGVLIHKERANAAILAGILLYKLSSEYDFSLVNFKSGNKDNAIPREAEFVIIPNDGQEDLCIKKICEMSKVLFGEYSKVDPDILISSENLEFKEYKIIDDESKKKIIDFLFLTPNGVINRSTYIDDLVETSLNLGIVGLFEDEFSFSYSVRSSVESRKNLLIEKISKLSNLFGAKIVIDGVYPSWEYKKDSNLRDLMSKIYREKKGKELKIEVIHAGLECGYILSKRPELDAVSYGPDMYDIHTTEERISISSIEKTYEFIIDILKEIR